MNTNKGEKNYKLQTFPQKSLNLHEKLKLIFLFQCFTAISQLRANDFKIIHIFTHINQDTQDISGNKEGNEDKNSMR